ncbi:MAG: hypothetical protein COU71_00375 [Parcubacteria group bacterium CG10_big_fil_rev_8_21_14_0_10_38_31]|nr:MAG: hypothetical protein COU71_00375 [Parcubacteria group bacterium CG10_big_fil_rev_8_21_14_0_10_38_31]
MRTSYSALDTYRTCPLKYKYQNLDKISAPKRIEAVFGSLVHSALKFMFERGPLYPTLDEVIDFFTDKWNKKSESIEWPNPDKKEEFEKLYFEEGVKIIKNFYKKNQPWKFNAVELESRFSVILHDDEEDEDHTIVGIIDRIDKDPEKDEYEIIDYKTGKKMPSAEMLKDNLQLSLYHMALQDRWPSLPASKIKLSLYFLKHNEKITAEKENPKEDIEKTKSFILAVIKEIKEKEEKSNFPPSPSALCDYCGYKKICPMWSHEYKKDKPETKSEEQIAEDITEFFEIKEDEEKNKKRLKELREDILAFMESSKVARVFGTRGFITKNVQERFSFDMEKVKEVLLPEDKWEEILSPDEKKLNKLLSFLSAKLQDKILSFRKKKEFIVLKQTKK